MKVKTDIALINLLTHVIRNFNLYFNYNGSYHTGYDFILTFYSNAVLTEV